MIYLFQRVIQNDNQWTKPSKGRLGQKIEGGYVGRNGFGHEDWNFNFDFEIRGYLYGFSYYEPAQYKQDEDFSIIYGIYKNKQWYLIGIYSNATFDLKPPIVSKIIEQKIKDIESLGNDLGNEWKSLSRKQKIERFEKESQWLSWKVKTENVLPTREPIPIPKHIYDSKNFRIANPTEISKATFDKLRKLNLSSIPNLDSQEEYIFPEGKLLYRKHLARERNHEVIRKAKQIFKSKYGNLHCQVCGFDFEERYGKIGNNYIEGHHTIPVSEMKENHQTKIEDIALVCANCHRMLHRKRPWVKMRDLKKLIQK